ncbi:hypothetical protein F5Y04DRAFT_292360 [Hypomontagnella monticulosa]|nr:hypothetical protein F5Y04DRAFT_292360 [Hypomontagnella monticulosa]
MPDRKRCRNLSSEGDYYAYRNRQKLYSAADNGCTICGIFRQAILGFLPVRLDLQTDYVAWTTKTKGRSDMFHPADSCEWQLPLRVQTKDGHIVLDRDAKFYALPEELSPWGVIPLAHHILTATDSKESYTFVSNALIQCLSSHRLCDSPRGRFLLSRLVDVVGPEASYMRVIETIDMDPEENEHYALNHCWGPPESITTQLNDET